VIEYLLMAFFVAQPPAAGASGVASARAEGPPPTVAPAQLRNPVEITSRLVTGTRGQATFTGDVLVKQRTLELRCDKMVAHYDGSREVRRVECVGNVRAVDEDRTARGERAEYDVPSGVLVVTGKPEARQGTTYLSGTRVRMTVGNENVEVENARVIVETAPLKDKKPRPGSAKKP
jgi:lipopolysaccharide export system protein LptA